MLISFRLTLIRVLCLMCNVIYIHYASAIVARDPPPTVPSTLYNAPTKSCRSALHNDFNLQCWREMKFFFLIRFYFPSFMFYILCLHGIINSFYSHSQCRMCLLYIHGFGRALAPSQPRWLLHLLQFQMETMYFCLHRSL